MKPIYVLVALAVVQAGSGCTPIQPLVLSDLIGPRQPMMGDDSSSGGTLIVYSDTDGPVFDAAEYSPHSGYKLYTMEGQLVRSVANRDRTISREPATVDLPVGQYKVIARAPNFGFVTVPVVIEKNLTTIVDLNGDVLPRSLPANEKWVRLPNGQVIGSKSELSSALPYLCDQPAADEWPTKQLRQRHQGRSSCSR